MNMDRLIGKTVVTEAIIGAAYKVANDLGNGFLEKVYENAHRAQCLNYLRVTGKEIGLVINFGRPRIEIQRVVCFCTA